MSKKKGKRNYKRRGKVFKPAPVTVNTLTQRLNDLNRLKPIIEAAKAAQKRAREAKTKKEGGEA